jgi:transposase
MSVRIVITESTTPDCTQASKLINGIKAEYLLADKRYDTDEILVQPESQGGIAVNTAKETIKVQRKYDKDLYKLRHLVENAFLLLKRWRGIASHYAKNVKSFWQQYKLDASLYGLMSRDYTI